MEIKEAIEKCDFMNNALNFQRADSDECSCALQMAISALEKQISMKPVFVHPLKFDNWIPCNERLPETFEPEAKAYLTTNEDGMIGVSYYHHGWSNGYESVFDVIAWQPLPEQYREEK